MDGQLDGLINWDFICAAPVCSDEERAKPKSKALDLPAGLHSDSPPVIQNES